MHQIQDANHVLYPFPQHLQPFGSQILLIPAVVKQLVFTKGQLSAAQDCSPQRGKVSKPASLGISHRSEKTNHQVLFCGPDFVVSFTWSIFLHVKLIVRLPVFLYSYNKNKPEDFLSYNNSKCLLSFKIPSIYFNTRKLGSNIKSRILCKIIY